MSHISANDLKTKGVAAIEVVLAEHAEAIAITDTAQGRLGPKLRGYRLSFV